MSSSRRHLGLTLVELLVVIALVALLAGVTMRVAGARPSAAAVAREVAALLTSARWLALGSGQPVTLLRRAPFEAGLVRLGAFTCDAEGAAPVWTPPARSGFAWPALGLAFAPDGRPRRCDGSAVGNATILIEGPGGDRAAVIVASLGRVRWERR